MTTSEEKIFLQPEYWTLSYLTDDGQRNNEHGFASLNAALKRLRTIQFLCYPSTIQEVELFQIMELEDIDQVSLDELTYLDDRFMQAMEDSNK
jgi:hypothetical protein